MKKSNGKIKEYILGKDARKRLKKLTDMVALMQTSRESLMRSWSGKGEEDVDEECGYPDNITFDMYKRMYLREGIARRIVNCHPEECWGVTPWVYETEDMNKAAETKFEKDWVRLNKAFNIVGKMKRLDEISRIGRYGVMLIGIDDGRSLSRRIDGIDEDGLARKVRNPTPRELLYLMPFDEGEARIEKFQEDRGSRRFGQPLYYNITFNDPNGGGTGEEQTVHWSRLIHVADNCMSSDIFGSPAQEPTYNYTLNLRKSLGGSAEMLWKGGFPGLTATTVPGLEVDWDKKSVEKEFEKYFSKLSRVIAAENMEIKTLQPNVEDPTSHIDSQIMAICIAINYPQRMFMGSEEARMASIMDSEMTNKRAHGRQNVHCDPKILRPLVDRLLVMRVLSQLEKKPLRGLKDRLNAEPEYFTGWPDLYAISGKDKADMTGVLVKALSDYITSGAARIFPPLQFLTMIMDFSSEQAAEIIKAAEVEAKKQDAGKSIAISPVQLASAGAQVNANAKIATAKGKPLPKSQKTPRAKSMTPPVKKGRAVTRKTGK